MPTIDADAHVIESVDTWSYMRDFEREFRPQLFRKVNDDGMSSTRSTEECWIIDGRVHTKGANVAEDVPAEARDLTDVERRLRHMDEIGVDVQVLYPSLFLLPLTTEHDLEFAILRSYNRWLADIWSQSHGRLRWVAMPPLLSLVDRAKVREELEFCKEHGACGIFLRGMECGRLITHRYFLPLFEIAQELDLALTFHAGVNSFAIYDEIPISAGNLQLFKFPVIGAFAALLETEIPKRYPQARWGFIEASAQWVPYALGEVELRLRRRGKHLPSNPFEGTSFFITTQRTDDLPWLVQQIGDDNLVVGTDYGHRDTATELSAFTRMAADATVPLATTEKILKTNPGLLYAIS